MLKSLFGDLTQHPSSDFAATAILETVTGEVNDRGQIVDRHVRDLFVTGSAAQAMRTHFASTHDDQAIGTRLVALHDPARMWSTSVVKALSDASGQPIERLHLRDQNTLATLAMIERTTLPRRMDDTLKIYNSDVRAGNSQANDIPIALMERSDLACVIVGPLAPAAFDEMLAALTAATFSPTWRCPHVLFLLPVGAAALSSRITTSTWPRTLQIQTLVEPLTSASAVWNALLSHWNRVKPAPGQLPAAASGWGGSDFPIKVADIAPAATANAPLPAPPAAHVAPHAAPHATAQAHAVPAALPVHGHPAGPPSRPPEPQRAIAMVQELLRLEGMLYAAVVDANTGLVIASEGHGTDIEQAGAAATEVLRAHRNSLRYLGHPRPQDVVDEILATVGSRYHIVRTLQTHPDHFVLAVLDKLRSNLAMARFRIQESQQALG